MGVFRTAIALTGWSSLATVGTFVALTRKSKVEDVPPNDYIYNHTQYVRLNPNNSPVTQDLCIRKVPLTKIKPELLEQENALITAFCRGVWGTAGYATQRRYLERKYRSPETVEQLWDQKDLQESTYEVGTLFTDHFEVVSKTPESIIVRGGGSPSVRGLRESDGLFEMTAVVNKEEGLAEFGLKSVFYNSLSGNKTPGQGPMPWTVQWLHQLYCKVLMESAVRSLTT